MKRQYAQLTALRLAMLSLFDARPCPCEEAPVVETENSIEFFDEQGRPMTAAPNAGQFQLLTGSPSAVSSLATATHARLTTYAVGLEQSPLDTLVDFLFPPVPTSVLFDYVVRDESQEFSAVEDDFVGASGRPSLVTMDADSVVQGKLLYRGLGTPYTAYDMEIDRSMPGNSLDRGRERRTRFVRNAVHNARAKRAIAALATATGAATGVSIATTDDPINKMRAYVTAVAEEMGSLDNVRITFGSTVWSGLLDHPFLCGGGSGNSRRTVTLEEVARLFEVRPENIMVCRHKALSTKQGNTKTKSYVLGADQVYVTGAKDRPDEYDNSFGKAFHMEINGQRFDVVVDSKGIHGEEVYLRYFELLKAVNTNAIKRLAVSYT